MGLNGRMGGSALAWMRLGVLCWGTCVQHTIARGDDRLMLVCAVLAGGFTHVVLSLRGPTARPPHDGRIGRITFTRSVRHVLQYGAQ